MRLIDCPPAQTPGINISAPVKDYLRQLRLGDVQCHEHVAIVPLRDSGVEEPPLFIGLAHAMEARTLRVTEISETGSVPQLLVFNDGHQPVLIIDGEELIGAKQNRVLDTSVLLKEWSQTMVPVSCTEPRRWNYTSAQFAASNTVLERRIRSRKSRSVHRSLKSTSTPRSDQREVWQGIAGLYHKAKFMSPTLALHDLVRAQVQRLKDYLANLPCLEGQVGLLVVINGRVAGLDVVSRPEVYAGLHNKLVRSYVLDTLLDQPTPPRPATEAHALAEAFIAAVETSREEIFPSVGYGRDHRYLASNLAGSALVHENRLIHAAFLSVDDASPTDSLSPRRNDGKGHP
jgi:hypothetical protein